VDGSATSISLKEGWNITDVRSSIGLRKYGPGAESSPDILLGSDLVWRGRSAAGLPLNVQMLVWQNPFPERKLARVKFSATKLKPAQDFRIALLALTRLNKVSPK
jgi:hypothetical protein